MVYSAEVAGRYVTGAGYECGRGESEARCGESECVLEANGEILLELPIAMMVVALDAVVETWIDKDLGTDPLVETEGEACSPIPVRHAHSWCIRRGASSIGACP